MELIEVGRTTLRLSFLSGKAGTHSFRVQDIVKNLRVCLSSQKSGIQSRLQLDTRQP